MVETFGAQYVSLHVRVSNVAAISLYKDTLKFKVEKVEAKYYADDEDAFSMRQDLGFIRDQIEESDEEAESVNGDAHGDEGEAVGDEGQAESGKKKKKAGEKLRKVKVGRALGVGDLVERVETKAT
jgi:hypothetical protein